MSQKSILVIGGAGYIGSHTVKELRTQGYSVVVLDNLSKGYKQSIETIDKNIPIYIGSLNDQSLLHEIFTAYDVSTVMHFAGLIEVGTSVQHPDVYYNNNLCDVVMLLDIMRKYNVNNFVFSSTAATFGYPMTETISETHPQNPINPYGCSKLMVEWVLRDYAHAFKDFHYCIFRYFNACGASVDHTIGQSYSPATHLIPIMLEAANGKREALQIFGTDYDTKDGTCIRDYIHVTDLAQAHILGMKRMLTENVSDDFNLGNGSGFSVKEMIEQGKEITGIDFKVIEHSRRPGDPSKLVADSTKATDILGWKPTLSLHTMIDTAWYWEQNRIY